MNKKEKNEIITSYLKRQMVQIDKDFYYEQLSEEEMDEIIKSIEKLEMVKIKACIIDMENKKGDKIFENYLNDLNISELEEKYRELIKKVSIPYYPI